MRPIRPRNVMQRLARGLKLSALRLARIGRLPGAPHVVALGAAVGAFTAFTPTLGLQMLLAALLASVLRASAAAAVAAVWITNPFTVGPIYAATYRVGARLYPDGSLLTSLTLGGCFLGLITGLITYTILRRTLDRRKINGLPPQA